MCWLHCKSHNMYAKAILACGSTVLFLFCRLFFAPWAKNNLQGIRNPLI